MRKVCFISGLPRSGSTMLGAILDQNPDFCAGMSSPVFSLVNVLLPKLSNANEFGVFFSNAKRADVLRGVFESYYQDQQGKVIFDTNRSWTQKLPVLLELFPDTKIVCCVRPINEILLSFEQQYLKNPLQLSQLIGYDPDTTVYVRTDRLMMGGGLIGLALNALKEAFYSENSDRLMLVSYQSLVTNTATTLARIYEFAGESLFEHDLGNVAFQASEFDALLGAPGLHSVRKQVRAEPNTVILPPDIIARYVGAPFWETDTGYSKADASLAKTV